MTPHQQAQDQGSDILELGVAIVRARPRLERRLVELTEDPARARAIAEATLQQGWRRRGEAPAADQIEAWLSDILRRQVLN